MIKTSTPVNDFQILNVSPATPAWANQNPTESTISMIMQYSQSLDVFHSQQVEPILVVNN